MLKKVKFSVNLRFEGGSPLPCCDVHGRWTMFELRVLEPVIIATKNPTLCKQQEFDFATSLVWFYLVCFFPGTFLYSPFCSFFLSQKLSCCWVLLFFVIARFYVWWWLAETSYVFNFLFYVCLPFYELKYSFKLQLCRYGKFSSVLKMEELLQFLQNTKNSQLFN